MTLTLKNLLIVIVISAVGITAIYLRDNKVNDINNQIKQNNEVVAEMNIVKTLRLGDQELLHRQEEIT
ncbi:hypothetical protein ISS03_04100, partial [Patescibacteria group bacterium]|nr:hypothetical protein [Patescibacteria group bacterium]